MATNETVTLTAELKDEMSAPIDKATKKVDQFTDAVVKGSKKQADANNKSTAQITGNTDKTAKKYDGLMGVFKKVGGAGSKMFDGIGRGLAKAGGGVIGRAKKLGGDIAGSIKEGLAVGGLGIAAVLSGAIALAGIGLAYVIYVRNPEAEARFGANYPGIYKLSQNRFYFDELYTAIVTLPAAAVAKLSAFFDMLVDGIVDLVGLAPSLVGAWLRPIQNGLVQFYALSMVLGLAVFLFILTLRGGR